MELCILGHVGKFGTWSLEVRMPLIFLSVTHLLFYFIFYCDITPMKQYLYFQPILVCYKLGIYIYIYIN